MFFFYFMTSYLHIYKISLLALNKQTKDEFRGMFYCVIEAHIELIIKQGGLTPSHTSGVRHQNKQSFIIWSTARSYHCMALIFIEQKYVDF